MKRAVPPPRRPEAEVDSSSDSGSCRVGYDDADAEAEVVVELEVVAALTTAAARTADGKAGSCAVVVAAVR